MDKVLLQTWKLQKCTEFSKSPKEMQWHEKLDIDSNTFENFNHSCDITYKLMWAKSERFQVFQGKTCRNFHIIELNYGGLKKFDLSI